MRTNHPNHHVRELHYTAGAVERDQEPDWANDIRLHGDALGAQVHRLQHALRRAMDRELSRAVVDEVNRRDGDMPSREWVSLRRATIESNAYANDGLEFGDLDGVTGDFDHRTDAVELSVTKDTETE